MMAWINYLPMTVRLPLAVGAMIFVVAVASTQLAIHGLTSRLERQVEIVGRVYLDGLWAALLPHVRAGDAEAARQALEYAFAFHDGIPERRIILLDANGDVVADVSIKDSASTSSSLPNDVARTDDGHIFDRSGRGVWTWRRLSENGTTIGTVAAHLDIEGLVSDRQRLRWLLIAVDLLFSGILAVVGFFLARRLQRPIDILTKHLHGATSDGPRRIDEKDIPKDDRDIARMLQAYNGMADATREREKIVAQLARQEREAVLGRLIATIAHEVRNPLAGILTAIGTARKFGDRPEARTSALDFIERGILALRAVVEATLDTHRAQGSWRDLRMDDMRDIQLLVAADAKTRDIAVEIDVELPDSVPVGATEVRQILLNLLLNAVAASPFGGRVRLKGQIASGGLQFDIWDEGPGMTPELTERLEGGTVALRGAGLGVDVIARLVKRLHGHLAVNATSGAGTHVTVSFPFHSAAASAT